MNTGLVIAKMKKNVKLTSTFVKRETTKNPKQPTLVVDKWICVLSTEMGAVSFDFQMGSGHNGKEPTLEDVLSCVLSDARAGEQTFEDFCSDFGYDEDSRSAEKIWNACKDATVKLSRILTKKDQNLFDRALSE